MKNSDEYKKTRIALDFPIALGPSVFILQGTGEEKLETAGIIIPETDDSFKMRGTIMSVGSEVKKMFIDHKGIERPLMPGDRVLFNLYANLNIIHKNVSYLCMSELDVYAVLPENTVVSNVKHKSRKGIKDVREQ